jgi:hypothetical protein
VYVACDTYISVDFLLSPHIYPEDGECRGHQNVEEFQHKMRLSKEVTGMTQATRILTQDPTLISEINCSQHDWKTLSLLQQHVPTSKCHIHVSGIKSRKLNVHVITFRSDLNDI